MSNQHTITEITDVANWLVVEQQPWQIGERAQVDLGIGIVEDTTYARPVWADRDGQWLWIVGEGWSGWFYGGAF